MGLWEWQNPAGKPQLKGWLQSYWLLTIDYISKWMVMTTDHVFSSDFSFDQNITDLCKFIGVCNWSITKDHKFDQICRGAQLDEYQYDSCCYGYLTQLHCWSVLSQDNFFAHQRTMWEEEHRCQQDELALPFQEINLEHLLLSSSETLLFLSWCCPNLFSPARSRIWRRAYLHDWASLSIIIEFGMSWSIELKKRLVWGGDEPKNASKAGGTGVMISESGVKS